MTLATCDESLFWYWITERHRIYTRRSAGEAKPWSLDPIFRKYKFVNVFRRLDRTSAWLIDHFLAPHHSEPELLAFNICWYRMFNCVETGERLGWQTGWDPAWVEKRLAGQKKVFTGAYIIHSDPGEPKVRSIARVCEGLWEMREGVVPMALDCGMRETWQYLQMQKHVGPFMAYQMVLDMMYTCLLEKATDRGTWACVGPGAFRGLRRLRPDLKPSQMLEAMQYLQYRSMKCLPPGFPPMDIHDIEFCLCELDKYCRVKYEEGRPRSTYPGMP